MTLGWPQSITHVRCREYSGCSSARRHASRTAAGRVRGLCACFACHELCIFCAAGTSRQLSSGRQSRRDQRISSWTHQVWTVVTEKLKLLDATRQPTVMCAALQPIQTAIACLGCALRSVASLVYRKARLCVCAILRLATSLLGCAQSTSTSSLCASSQER